MRSKWVPMMFLLGALLAGAGFANATDRTPKNAAEAMPGANKMERGSGAAQGEKGHGVMKGGMGHGMMQGGMGGGTMQGGMGGGMMNMMGMMNACGHMSGGGTMLHLPPGNAKLQLQMQAELMQKTGEILAKYADKIKDEPRSTP